MEKDFKFGFHQQLHPSLHNLNSLHFPFDTGCSNAAPVFMNLNSAEDSTLRTAPLFPVSPFQQLRLSEPYEPRNGFYHVPDSCQTFGTALNTASEENVHTGIFDFGQNGVPTTMGTAQNQKRFLVFDQSGDNTTLIYGSRVQTLFEYGTNWTTNPLTTYIMSKEVPDGSIRPSILSTSVEDNSRDVMEDEMHEDTEELNALLCSGSDSDFSVNDDETSTGHSPSTMTENSIHDPVEETEAGEEINSYVGSTKRQKLLDGGYGPSDRHIASSLKSFMSSSLEDDAESHCGNGSKLYNEELEFWAGNKRLRKEKIHETLNNLQGVIPNMNGKDAIVIIDEAIHYLKSLKVEAKALGLDNI